MAVDRFPEYLRSFFAFRCLTLPGRPVLAQFMAWWGKRKEEREATLIAALTTAFAGAIGGVLSAQTAQIQQQGAFLGTLQDLSARKAAQVLGSRGGRRTTERKKKARDAVRAVQECVLCHDPMHRGTTLAQIDFHRQHGEIVPVEASSPPTDEPERGN